MARFFYKLSSFIHLMRVLAKHSILNDRKYIKPSFAFGLIVKLISFVFAPIRFFIRPKDNFGKRLNKALQELGPIYIKLGQTISTRPDFIGAETAKELRYLQDKLPEFSAEIAKDQIRSAFGKDLRDIFAHFEDAPVAAASVAQVHKAKLASGESVAVKVLRPNIKNIYEKDIIFLEGVAWLLSALFKKYRRLKLTEVIAVFRKSMEFELNLLSEAASAAQVQRNFQQDADLVTIPKIYWQLCCDNILTSEWIDGCSVYDHQSITKMGHNLSDIAQKIANVFFNMTFRDGYFHADMHAGNIIICKNGKIALIDFGIIGALSEKDRIGVAEILYAFVQKDYDRVAEIHKDIGFIPHNTDLKLFAQSCRSVAEPIFAEKAGNIYIGNLLGRLFEITEEYGMNTQPQILLLQKNMVLVEGIGQSLDKNKPMWELAEPWIKKWAARNLSPEAKILKFATKIIKNIQKELY